MTSNKDGDVHNTANKSNDGDVHDTVDKNKDGDVNDASHGNKEGDNTKLAAGDARGGEKNSSRAEQTNKVAANGTKLKMPASQLQTTTRAQTRVKELQKAHSVEQVVLDAVRKFETELQKLTQECSLVSAVNRVQQDQKDEWIAKNVQPKLDHLQKIKNALNTPKEIPTIIINDNQSKRDGGSYVSSSSRLSEAAREAAAEEAALRVEKERMIARRRQEEEEEQLRQQQQRLKSRREQDDLEAKIEQARIRREMLEDISDAASERRSRIGGRSHRTARSAGSRRAPSPAILSDLPRLRQPTTQWLQEGSTDQFAENPGAEEEPIGGPALMRQMLLPKTTMPIFNGDVTQFLWFIRAFKLNVEDVTTNPARRLHLLLQHLDGEPHSLVLGCQLAAEPAEGYQRAKAKLLEEYGSPFKQTRAFKQKIFNWPAVKSDAADLKAFSTYLQLCSEVKVNGHMSELDASTVLVTLMKKLPSRMQDSWQRRACKIEAQSRSGVTFEDFAFFVKEQSDALNHPVFGKATGAPAEAPESVKGRAKTMVTTTKSGNAAVSDDVKNAFKSPCILCDGQHSANHCTNQSLSIEEKKEKLRGLCFACLRPGHPAKYCKSRAICTTCQGKHPTVLHDKTREKAAREKADTNGPVKSSLKGEETAKKEIANGVNEAKSVKEKSCLTLGQHEVTVSAVPVRVWLQNRSSSIVVRAVLDNASSASFVSQKLLQQLGIMATTTSLELATMNSTTTQATQVVHGLQVSDTAFTNIMTVGTAYIVPKLPVEASDLPTRVDVRKWPHLQDIPLDYEHMQAPVEMLLGANVPAAVIPQHSIEGPTTEHPFAVRTRLGWTVNGPIGLASKRKVVSNLIRTRNVSIENDLRRLYASEFQDAYDFRTKGPSQEDNDWLRYVTSTIQRTTLGKYEIALPFRERAKHPQRRPAPVQLPNNRQQALQRLRSLQHKFARNTQFKSDYVDFMNKMENNGFVEQVREENAELSSAFYVPHHGVYHPRKPGKLRVVFNCSCKYQGTSLNDCLLQGPDLTSSLVGVLTRFRLEPVAFMADIESMFYQVLVPEEDRDYLRYLWWPGGDVTKPVQTYRMRVHLFGATSSPSCANFALQEGARTAAKDIKNAVMTNFYVDDCLKSMPDENSAIKMAKGLIAACHNGGFKLCKFISNSPAMLEALDKALLSSQLQEIDFNKDKQDVLGSLAERALGIAWKIKEDEFYFKVAIGPADSQVVTNRRKVLAVLSAVYDPLGFAAPFIIKARILFRDITKEGIDWDADLAQFHQQHYRSWINWIQELPNLQSVTIPRCLKPYSGTQPWQLHVFCDASLEAYASVAYLRQASLNQTHVVFIFGKARVSPPKVVTVPRLELTAAKLATDIASMIQKELASAENFVIEKRFFWSDSQTVLKYLSNRTKRFHTFVANRVCSILETTDIEEWRFVPTHLNPADEGTRGAAPGELQRWLHGPRFLQDKPCDWPTATCLDAIADTDPEVKVLATHATETIPFVEEWASRYSSAYRLRRAAAILIMYKRVLRDKQPGCIERINVNHLNDAEQALIWWLQNDSWTDEIDLLNKEERLPKHSALYKLSPKLQDKLVCMSTRTRESLPIIPHGKFALLLVKEAHERAMHFGRSMTAAMTLKRYWIVGLNKIVRKVVKECALCQLHHSRPHHPVMAVLPDFRLQVGPPFESTGVDYFGPLRIKLQRSRGHSSDKINECIKAYGVLFTCASTRAVHLEVASDLSSNSFINALRRFISRRGHCKRLVSDQGTNFKGANAELQSELQKEVKGQDHDEIARHLRVKGIEWIFNAPGASHHGGFWERLIRSVRRAIEASVTQSLTLDSLNTLLCEIESVLNSRPITPVTDDANDLEALTPNHLLLGRAGPTRPPGISKGRPPGSASQLQTHWRRVQFMADQFWRRWLKEYKVLLHQRPKWHQRSMRPFEVNDIVLVVDPVQPREYWQLGRVIHVHPNRTGSDCEARVLDVQTQNGTTTRPASKLCLLETASLLSSKQ